MTQFFWNLEHPGKRYVLSGNEAAARGALESGVQIATSYPGSPSAQILASDLIARACCDEGYLISVGETFGATQRGGSVVSHIRLSQKQLYGPLIPLGECHIMIGFEPLEVYRILLDYGHDSVRVVMNDRPFYPLDVLQKRAEYPAMDELISYIRLLSADLQIVQGTDLAIKAGNSKAQNVVMVGAVAGLNWIPMGKERFLKGLEGLFAGARLEVNRRAFDLGFNEKN